ncbi:hypothetical protein MYSTI_07473 [Myxococcus stipitatus DSM 14675]|uniref:Uncharacterized protein n=1 Tax=Myxococcus stipitatus (strain DSM 14675 / JCM 12634 / Mx s8) TaxID=1278073 RepID=L7ULF4_MYXSD|nr:hypothetical protein MYSTI_07473 [Myxococcus stipitatus DSM 14675]
MVEMTRSDKTTSPPPYVRDEHRVFSYETLPPDVTFKSDTILFKRKTFITSVLVMLITSFAVFYLPLFNGFIAGAFGGFHARTLKRAMGAAVVSAIALPLFFAFFAFMAGPTELRIFGGLGFWGWALTYAISLLIGAATGAYSRPLLSDEISAAPTRVPAGAPPRRSTPSTDSVTRVVTAERTSLPIGPAHGA